MLRRLKSLTSQRLGETEGQDNFPWRVGMVSMELYEVEEFYEAEESEYHDCL